ncbi:MAG: hypothetical protein DMF83_31010 [Acidobacteria bacterium]|nr:MAG: hypothetical protein DMF83_31010 [Acidobacteriota bacterium]
MRRLRLIAAVVLVTAFGFGVWAFAFEPASLTTRTHELFIPSLLAYVLPCSPICMSALPSRTV